jgi:hypothetical protein
MRPCYGALDFDSDKDDAKIDEDRREKIMKTAAIQ